MADPSRRIWQSGIRPTRRRPRACQAPPSGQDRTRRAAGTRRKEPLYRARIAAFSQHDAERACRLLRAKLHGHKLCAVIPPVQAVAAALPAPHALDLHLPTPAPASTPAPAPAPAPAAAPMPAAAAAPTTNVTPTPQTEADKN